MQEKFKACSFSKVVMVVLTSGGIEAEFIKKN